MRLTNKQSGCLSVSVHDLSDELVYLCICSAVHLHISVKINNDDDDRVTQNNSV